MRDNNSIIDNTDVIVMGICKSQITKALRSLGNIGLEYAQQRHGFKNQTFNLEDSYGYGIYYDGLLIEKTLSTPKSTKTKRYKGRDVTGLQMAEEFLSGFHAPAGYSLVVVAGMFYAEWVEKKHNLDVLLGAYNLTTTKVDKYFSKWESYYEQ